MSDFVCMCMCVYACCLCVIVFWLCLVWLVLRFGSVCSVGYLQYVLEFACDNFTHPFSYMYLITFYYIHTALMSYRMGDFQDSYTLATKALKLHPHHVDSKELQAMLQKTFLNT